MLYMRLASAYVGVDASPWSRGYMYPACSNTNNNVVRRGCCGVVVSRQAFPCRFLSQDNQHSQHNETRQRRQGETWEAWHRGIEDSLESTAE
jgi:hypothetical protein